MSRENILYIGDLVYKELGEQSFRTKEKLMKMVFKDI